MDSTKASKDGYSCFFRNQVRMGVSMESVFPVAGANRVWIPPRNLGSRWVGHRAWRIQVGHWVRWIDGPVFIPRFVEIPRSMESRVRIQRCRMSWDMWDMWVVWGGFNRHLLRWDEMFPWTLRYPAVFSFDPWKGALPPTEAFNQCWLVVLII